jgi:putative ABC transport system permease protein
MTESLLLSLIGGAGGILLSLWGTELLGAVSRQTEVPRAGSIALNGRVLLFSFAVSLATGLIFGSVPAFQGSRPDLNEALKEGGRGSSLKRGRTRQLLVGFEVALALVLLVGAGLLINSFLRLRSVDPGLQPDQVLTMNINLPRQKYPQAEQVIEFHQRLLTQVEAVPGVEYAGTALFLPYGGSSGTFGYTLDSSIAEGQVVSVVSQQASPNLFRALGIPVLRGRAFNERDADGSEPSVIISESLAKRYWPDQEPLGQRIKWGDGNFGSPWMTVVGVVGDTRLSGLASEVRPALYIPNVQLGEPVKMKSGITLRDVLAADARTINLVVRTTVDPERIANDVRNAVWAVDPNQPVTRVRTMDKVLADTMIMPRFNTWFFGTFSGVALLLAAAGIYGVISYSVSQRTRGIGVRMALGAQPRDVLRLIVGQGMLPAFIGLVTGLAGAYGLTRFMATLLFSVKPTDPPTFAAISALLVLVALLACYLPARRASKVDPMVALRYE